MSSLIFPQGPAHHVLPLKEKRETNEVNAALTKCLSDSTLEKLQSKTSKDQNGSVHLPSQIKKSNNIKRLAARYINGQRKSFDLTV